jgi:siroheme synthase (precorrin-2 oxidase/ferrochelatase)
MWLPSFRLLMKTQADITVFAEQADVMISQWHDEGKLRLMPRGYYAAEDIDNSHIGLSQR